MRFELLSKVGGNIFRYDAQFQGQKYLTEEVVNYSDVHNQRFVSIEEMMTWEFLSGRELLEIARKAVDNQSSRTKRPSAITN